MANGKEEQPAVEEELNVSEVDLPLHRDRYLEFKRNLENFSKQNESIRSIERDLMKSISNLLYGNDDEMNVERVREAYGNLTIAELRERNEEARFLSVWELRAENPPAAIPRVIESLVVLAIAVGAGMLLLTELVWRSGGGSLLLILYSVSVAIGALALLETVRGVTKHVRKEKEE